MTHTLPPGWEEKTLGEVCEIERGGSPRPIKSYLTTAPTGLNWIKIGDTSPNSKYIYSVKEKIRPEGLAKSRWVQEGDFLLSNSMSFGRPYILKTNGCIHDGWLVLKQYQSNLQCDFLYYLLSSPFVQKQFQQSAQGSTVRNLNTQRVAKIIIPIPPLLEQKRIVGKLNKIFAAIDKAKSQTEKNLQNAKDVFSSYLNNIFNHPAHNWEEKKLGELCDVLDFRRKPITRKDRTRGLYPYYGATGIVDFIDSFLFDEPLLLVGEDGARWGSGEPCAFIASGKYWVNNHAHVLKPKNCMSMQYLVYFLNYSDLTPYITGTTVLKLNQQKLRSISVPSPSLPEQKRIVEKLDVLQSKTQELEKIYTQKLKDLEELKQAVLQQAFSGKL
ncbi:restriction endonuclease subunit S [Candidatus Avelusimicrobium faecicola]|uniref:restriction endonuclease subunit S n=1 Tax=Candidatus Avelusimicrobium faecicola TaxID=3416205 RepID=UPI003D126031